MARHENTWLIWRFQINIYGMSLPIAHYHQCAWRRDFYFNLAKKTFNNYNLNDLHKIIYGKLLLKMKLHHTNSFVTNGWIWSLATNVGFVPTCLFNKSKQDPLTIISRDFSVSIINLWWIRSFNTTDKLWFVSSER